MRRACCACAQSQHLGFKIAHPLFQALRIRRLDVIQPLHHRKNCAHFRKQFDHYLIGSTRSAAPFGFCPGIAPMGISLTARGAGSPELLMVSGVRLDYGP